MAALCQKLTELLRQAGVLTSDGFAIAGPAVIKLAAVCKLAISIIQEDVRGADCAVRPGQINTGTLAMYQADDMQRCHRSFVHVTVSSQVQEQPTWPRPGSRHTGTGTAGTCPWQSRPFCRVRPASIWLHSSGAHSHCGLWCAVCLLQRTNTCGCVFTLLAEMATVARPWPLYSFATSTSWSAGHQHMLQDQPAKQRHCSIGKAHPGILH